MELLKIYPTGSSYICDPPVTDTDIDFIILVSDLSIATTQLQSEGWELTSIYYKDGLPFSSFRLGKLNYIVTEESKYYKAFVKATEAAKLLNVTDKNLRCELFTTVFKLEGYLKND